MNNGESGLIRHKMPKKLFGWLGSKGKFKSYYLLTAFAIPFIIMLGVYACLGKHPFGNYSVLTLDLQAQYIYYYEALRRLLTEGGSFLYSWERTLGGEFMGIFAYYAASPFNLIFVLFPKSMLPDAVMFMQLCKVGAMGSCFAYYLRKTRDTLDMMTVSFSTMYALSAYAVVQLIDPMWLDAMVFLPLLILGVEAMIRQKRFVLYTVSLTMLLVTNYYMGYMCCIFTLIYYLYYYFLVRDELPQNEKAKTGNFFSRMLHSRGFETFLRFAVFTVIAGLTSAFILLCAWYSLHFGKTDFAKSNFDVNLRFDFFDIFVKMLPGSYDTVRPNGLPMIYSGTLSLIGLPLFFMSPTISRKKKFLSAGVLAILILSFSINTIDLVWHGFSMPNWLNYRYSYLFSFFVVVLACDGVRGMRKIPFGRIAATGVALAGLVLIVQKLSYSFEQNGKTKTLDGFKCIMLSIVLIIAYMIVLRFLKTDNLRSAGAFALAMVVCVEMFAAAIINVSDVEMDVGVVRYDNYLEKDGKTENYSGYVGSVKRIEPIVNEVMEKDKTFYRMETKVTRMEGGVNEQMAYGMNGISHSTSTLNVNVIALMNKLGYASTDHWTKYYGGTPVSDALLGIKYVITKDDLLDKNLYTVAASGEEYYKYIPSRSTIYAMQNTKALSVAYGVSPDLPQTMKNFIDPPNYSSLDLQNKLINAMLSDVIDTPNVVRGIYARPEKYEKYSHDFTYTDENGEVQKVTNSYYKSSTGELVFKFTAEADGDIYCNFPVIYKTVFQGMERNGEIIVNDKKVSAYFTNNTSCIQKLGYFNEGDSVEIKVRNTGDYIYISNASKYLFYYIDYAALNKAFTELEASSMYVEKFGNDFLEGTIDLPEGQELIFTSIPYDEGWHVYIDGKRAETTMVLDSLLAVPSTAGFHEIKFVYRPSCAVFGGLLTAIGIVLFALFVLWSKSRKVRALVKCDDERDTHFFYYAGDKTEGWISELMESELANAGNDPDEPKEQVTKAPKSECETEAVAHDESETVTDIVNEAEDVEASDEPEETK